MAGNYLIIGSWKRHRRPSGCSDILFYNIIILEPAIPTHSENNNTTYSSADYFLL
jgi:hypothetical protein